MYGTGESLVLARRWVRFALLAGLLPFSTCQAIAQAWIPEKGEGAVSLYLSYGVTGDHFFEGTPAFLQQILIGTPYQGVGSRKFDLGKVTSFSSRLTARYSFARQWSVDGSLSYIRSKYDGVRPESAELDDGEWHGYTQDAIARIRWQAYNKRLVLTPQAGLVIPASDYPSHGHVAPGAHLKEAFAGFAIGTAFGTRVPTGYVQAQYVYSFVENVGEYGMDRSNIVLEVGVFASSRLVLRGFGFYRNTYDGFSWLDIDPSNFGVHDQVAEADVYGAGAQAVITLAPSWDLSVGIDGIFNGENTHELLAGSVGITYNFGRSLQFAPQQRPEESSAAPVMPYQRASEGGRFQVSLSSTQSPPPLGRAHEWTVRVTDRNNAPIEHAEITIQGQTAEHDRDLPTEPRVTRYLNNGYYLIEGVKFDRAGQWELSLDIHAGDVEDRVSFDITVEH